MHMHIDLQMAISCHGWLLLACPVGRNCPSPFNDEGSTL